MSTPHPHPDPQSGSAGRSARRGELPQRPRAEVDLLPFDSELENRDAVGYFCANSCRAAGSPWRSSSTLASSAIDGLCPTSASVQTSGGDSRTTRSRSLSVLSYTRSSTTALATGPSSAPASCHVCDARRAGDTTTRSGSRLRSASHRPTAAASTTPRSASGRSASIPPWAALACRISTSCRAVDVVTTPSLLPRLRHRHPAELGQERVDRRAARTDAGRPRRREDGPLELRPPQRRDVDLARDVPQPEAGDQRDAEAGSDQVE